MKITRLELRGFNRMALRNVLLFALKPTEPIQLILGTNGSGKSSLLLELTPLPADPSAYCADGSKTIEITHRSCFYVLRSDFSVSKPHSFVKDGEELNPGGGVTVQRELVKQEFDITPDIHDLMIGLEKFHAMPLPRRREWFTRLSDVSYDYAMAVFRRLSEKSRDLTGALKLAKKRLVTESAKVISPTEEERLLADVEVTLRELNVLIEQSAPLDRPVADIKRDQTEGMDELQRMSRRLLNMRYSAPYGTHPYGRSTVHGEQRDDWGQLVRPGFTSLEEIDLFIDGIRHQITEKETLLNAAVLEHVKIQETVQVLTRTGEVGRQTLIELRSEKAAQRLDALNKRKLSVEGLDATNAASALDSVYEILSATFSALPENGDRRFSQAKLTEIEQTSLQTKDLRERQAHALTRLHANKAHAESHKANGKMQCPECHHVWIAGFSDERFQELLEQIGEAEDALAKTDKLIKEHQLEIEAIREYSTLYSDFSRTVRNWPVLQPFWLYLMNDALVTRSPRKALNVLETFRHDMQYELQAKTLDREIVELEGLIIDAEKVGDASLIETQQKLDDCTLRVEGLTAEVTQLRTWLGDYAMWRRQLAEAHDLGNRIHAQMIMQEKHNEDMVEAIRRETLNHCVRQLQHSLAIKQRTLNDALTQREIVKSLEAHITELAVQEEAAKIVVKQLSPTEGILAEGLFGFIRNFTGQMNNLIRKIWSYPLQVMDCGISGASGVELDYRFPLLVKSKDNIVSDVKLGSSGMQEIVDLAFMVVARRYLGLAETPLYLDELGKTFDEAHRTAATAVIKGLMESQPFTQLYMISHYESIYGAFTNAEITVLEGSNITTPATAKYNQHVVIE